MSYHERTTHAAKGKWRGILMTLGLPESALTGKHTACPLCGSGDNFRWDNVDGTGSYICTCGAGQGMKLAMEFTGREFRDVSSQIDGLLGNIKVDAQPQRKVMDEGDRRELLRATYAATVPMQAGDLADAYLTSRALGQTTYPSALRFGASLRDGEGGTRPCIVALVGVHGETDAKGRQKFCSLHRTFLRTDGKGKAEMASPRKLMPGELPEGACVMLSDWTGGAIGIAEGIETALAATALYGVPCWAGITAGMMAKWTPPADADEVVIFGDNDPRFAGQAAAYGLAHRIATNRTTRHMEVKVMLPRMVGTDFADELLAQRGAA